MSERKALLALLFLIFAVILLRTAWLGDDAYITMRSVDNWVNGYGLTWNPGERVQTFTHPFWMLLLSGLYALSKNAYFSLLGLSLLASLALMAVFLSSVSRNLPALAWGWLLLVFSHAFLDYSTSGLENPLSHLLALVFALVFLGRISLPASWRTFALSLLAGLAVLNRMDTLLLYLPALALVFWQDKTRRTFAQLTAGFLPFVLWSLFALFYYGFIFPNTYYAKLNTAIPKMTLLHQGLVYYLNELLFDPLTLVIIVCGLGAAFFWGEARQRAIGLGMLFYLGYILYIGGDLMSGRFFSIVFLLSVALFLPYFEQFSWQGKSLAALAVLFLGVMAPSPAFLPPSSLDLETANRSGISDERAFYYSAVTTNCLNTNGLAKESPCANKARRSILAKGLATSAFMPGRRCMSLITLPWPTPCSRACLSNPASNGISATSGAKFQRATSKPSKAAKTKLPTPTWPPITTNSPSSPAPTCGTCNG